MNKELDFRGFIADAAARIAGMDLERRPMAWYHSRTDTARIVVTPDMVRRHLLTSVWNACLDALGEEKDLPPMNAERTMAELFRHLVPRENIQVREGAFRLRLDNCEYCIFRRDGQETVARPRPSELWSVIRIGPERFADFLLRFDAHVPEILAEVPSVLEAIHEREREEQKRKMELEIRKTAVRALIKQYLEPMDLSVGFKIEEDGQVELFLKRIETARLRIAMEYLPETLGDTAWILSALTPEPVRIDDEDEVY